MRPSFQGSLSVTRRNGTDHNGGSAAADSRNNQGRRSVNATSEKRRRHVTVLYALLCFFIVLLVALLTGLFILIYTSSSNEGVTSTSTSSVSSTMHPFVASLLEKVFRKSLSNDGAATVWPSDKNTSSDLGHIVQEHTKTNNTAIALPQKHMDLLGMFLPRDGSIQAESLRSVFSEKHLTNSRRAKISLLASLMDAMDSHLQPKGVDVVDLLARIKSLSSPGQQQQQDGDAILKMRELYEKYHVISELPDAEGHANRKKPASNILIDKCRLYSAGYVRATGSHYHEAEVLRPMDELELLMYRHHWNVMSSSPQVACSQALMKDAPHVNNNTISSCLHARHEAARQKRVLHEMPSALNRKYYYPLRRWERIGIPFEMKSLAVADAVHTALLTYTAHYVDMFLSEGSRGGEHVMVPGSRDGLQPVSHLRARGLNSKRIQYIRQYLTEDRERELMPQDDIQADTRSLFVSIASYRDIQCGPSVVDLFSKAKNPSRIYVGIAQQNEPGDVDCVPDALYEPMPCYKRQHVNDINQTTGRFGMGDFEKGAKARIFGSAGGADDGSDDALNEFSNSLCFVHDNIRIRRVRSSQAFGPTYGRYMAMLLYGGESLAFIIDSHNRFRPFWDTLGVHLWHKYDDVKTALSHYPEAYDLQNTNKRLTRDTTAYLCRCKYLPNNGYVRLSGIIVRSPAQYYGTLKFNDPYVRVQHKDVDPSRNFRMPQPWIAGGFLFSNGNIMREVPFDPHLPYLFDGEEVLYGMRLWTHGYNLYSPERNLVFHFYTRAAAPKVWDHNHKWSTIQAHSRRRVQYFLRVAGKGTGELLVPQDNNSPAVAVDAGRYGAGNVRSVDTWYSFAGLNKVEYTFDGRWCGND